MAWLPRPGYTRHPGDAVRVVLGTAVLALWSDLPPEVRNALSEQARERRSKDRQSEVDGEQADHRPPGWSARCGNHCVISRAALSLRWLKREA